MSGTVRLRCPKCFSEGRENSWLYRRPNGGFYCQKSICHKSYTSEDEVIEDAKARGVDGETHRKERLK